MSDIFCSSCNCEIKEGEVAYYQLGSDNNWFCENCKNEEEL